jgi:chromosome segregation ATPase
MLVNIHFREKISGMKEKLRTEDENLKTNEKQLTALNDQIKVLEAEKQDLMKNWQKLDSQRIKYLNHIKNLKSEVASFESLIKKNQKSLTDADKQQQEQNRSLQNLITLNRDLENSLTLQTDKCEQLQQEKDEAMGELNRAIDAQKRAEELLAQLRDQERELMNQKSQAEREEQDALQQKNNAQHEWDIAEEKVNQAKTKLEGKDNELKSSKEHYFLFWISGEEEKREKQKAYDDAKRELEQAEQKLENKKRTLSDNEKKYQTAKNKTCDLNDRLKQKTEDRIKQDTQLITTVENVATGRSKLDSISTQHREATVENKKLTIQKKNTENNIEDTRMKIVTLTGEIDKYRQDLAENVSLKKKKSEEIETMTETLKNHTDAMKEHQDSIESNKKKLTDRASDLAIKQANLQIIKQRFQDLKQSLSDEESNEKSKLLQIENERNMLEADKKSVQELKKDIAEKRNQVEIKAEQFASNKINLARLETRMKDLQKEKSKDEQDLSDSKDKLERNNILLRAKQTAVDEQIIKMESLTAKLSLLEAQERKVTNEIEYLQEKIARKDGEIERNNKNTDSIKEKIQGLNSDRQQLKATWNATRAKIRDIDDGIKQNHAAMIEKEETCTHVKENLQRSLQHMQSYEEVRKHGFNTVKECERVLTDIHKKCYAVYYQTQEQTNQILQQEFQHRPDAMECIKSNYYSTVNPPNIPKPTLRQN